MNLRYFYVTTLCVLLCALLIIIDLRIQTKATEEDIPEIIYISNLKESSYEEPVPDPVPLNYTQDDVYILAQAMTGECYEFEYDDMLNVGMTILNRVDYDGSKYNFPNTIEEVIKQPNQIHGYSPDVVPSETALLAAAEVLGTWNAIKNGEDLPWNYDILFWCAGGGTTNVFRSDY